MQHLSKEEETLLFNVCKKYEVDPNHLRILLLLEKEYSYKNMSKSQACRNDIMRNIAVWVNRK